MKREKQALLMKMQLGSIKNGGHSRQQNRNIEYELYSSISEIISKWNEQDMKMAASYICTVRSKSFDIFRNNLFPKDSDSVMSRYFISKECSFEKMVMWYSFLINQFSKEINKYVLYKQTYEKLFVVGFYNEANDLVDTIEKEFGKSVWGMDCRFAICEYDGGLEANKAFLEKIVSSRAGVWTKFIADFLSFKDEKNVNNRQYVNRIEKVFKEDNSDVTAFFKELLYPIQNLKDEDSKGVMRLSLSLSLIDIYNAFVKVCIRLIASDNTNYISILRRAFQHIDGINDIVFQKLKWAVSEKNIQIEFSDRDSKLYRIGDLYTRGKYDEVIEYINNQEVLINCFEAYEYFVKAHIMADKELVLEENNCVRTQLISAMYSAYVKTKNVEQSYFVISKFVRLFSNSYLGTELAYFFADKFWEGTFPILKKGKLLSANANNINMVLFDRQHADDILEYYSQIDSENATYKLFLFLIHGKETDAVEKNRKRWYQIKRYLEGNSSHAIQELEVWNRELKEVDTLYAVYQRERVVLELYKLYIQEKDYLKAEVLAAEVCVDNPYAYLRIDLTLIRDAVFVKNREWKSNICTPIVTYLYDKEDFTAIYSATANFLRSNGYRKPSAMFGLEEKFGANKLTFFLKKVCIKEVLDSMYDAFETDDDVENERIEICKYLQARDQKNASVYIEEISRILQSRKVRQGVKYFEDVKIDIDFDRIYDSYKKTFHENYERFREMERLNVDYATYDVQKGVWILDLNVDPKTYSHTYLSFKELFDGYRKEVTYGKFGLDTILGSRIRHGILQNQIRVVFGNNNLIFVSKSTENTIKYVATSEIQNICIDLGIEEKNIVYNILADFSQKVDNYTDEIVKNYIRINIDDKNPLGIFGFSYNSDYIHALMSVAKSMQNEILLREYFDKIWMIRIEQGIERAKCFVQGEVKSTFILMLKELEEKISKSIKNIRVKDYFLNAISKSRTELQQSMDCISEWFKIPEEQKMENFSADYLVETCDYINKRVVSNFENIRIESKIETESDFKGKTFSYMVDIFIILYTNAFYHSGYLDNLNQLKIGLSIIEKETELVVEMRNNLSETIDRTELADTVSEIQEKLETCINSGEYYNYEGKSGYIKICKILNYNLECNGSYLEFGLTDNNEDYFIRIVLPKTIMVDKESA